MTFISVPQLPPPPLLEDDEGTFDSKAVTWTLALTPWTTAVNSSAENISDNALTAETKADEAVIPSARADDVFVTMEELASTRVVWVADKFEAGSIYGFYTDFTPTHSTHPLVYASLKIEGLI